MQPTGDQKSNRNKSKKVLTKKNLHVGMTSSCKSKETRWDDSCKCKGTRWDDTCKSKGTIWNDTYKSKTRPSEPRPTLKCPWPAAPFTTNHKNVYMTTACGNKCAPRVQSSICALRIALQASRAEQRGASACRSVVSMANCKELVLFFLARRLILQSRGYDKITCAP